MKNLAVMAKRPKQEYETETHWMRVGMATVLDDGNVLITVNAIPLNWDGQLKLVAWEKKP